MHNVSKCLSEQFSHATPLNALIPQVCERRLWPFYTAIMLSTSEFFALENDVGSNCQHAWIGAIRLQTLRVLGVEQR